MSRFLSPSREQIAGSRFVVFAVGATILGLVLRSIVSPHQWLSLRQAIPVSMSLAEAESKFNAVSNASKKQVELIYEGADSLFKLSLLPDIHSDNNLLGSLRQQTTSIKTLESQYAVLEKQLAIYAEAFEKELLAWTNESEKLSDFQTRLDAEGRILNARGKFEERLEKAQRELRFIKNVIDEAADIERLLAMAEHESAINHTLDSMDSLTSEVHSFATKLQSTTQSVLNAWASRS